MKQQLEKAWRELDHWKYDPNENELAIEPDNQKI